MSGQFGAQAARLFSVAARTLGWSPATFWAATPADLALALADPAIPPVGLTRADIDRLLENDDHG